MTPGTFIDWILAGFVTVFLASVAAIALTFAIGFAIETWNEWRKP